MSTVWLPEAAILAIHAELLVEHGGAQGQVDEQALGSTLSRPQQLAHYGNPEPDLAALAASYGYGFARNHPFTDGNKRVALVSMDVFLQMNGHELTASELDALNVIQLLAAGDLDESSLADWVRTHMKTLM